MLDPGDGSFGTAGRTVMTQSRATVFGARTSKSDASLPSLQGAAAPARPVARSVGERPRRRAARSPGPRTPTLVCDERRPDGSVLFQIESHPERGLPDPRPRLWRQPPLRRRSRLICSQGEAAEQAWQRLLVAQVLPFAALLRGLEVFHASGVVREGRRSRCSARRARGRPRLRSRCVAGMPSSWPTTCSRWSGRQRPAAAHPGTPVAGVDREEPDSTARWWRSTTASASPGPGRSGPGAAGGAVLPRPARRTGPPSPVFEPGTDRPDAARRNLQLRSRHARSPRRPARRLRGRRRSARGADPVGPGSDPARLADAIVDRLG